MPLPTDQKLLDLSKNLLQQFGILFGQHPGFRPAHAKGVLLSGTFTPTAQAASLTRAPHLISQSIPVIARFSNSTGLPLLPDNDPNANPRGLAIRFQIGEHVHTDVISHSTDGFPTHTGEEFLEMLRAIASSDPSAPRPNPIEIFLGSHPTALAYVQTPKPTPSSFARESFFGVSAMLFSNQAGDSRYGRYRIVPEAGVDHLPDGTTASLSPTFLFDELVDRIALGPVAFRILVQLANTEDTVDNATIHWPENRTQIDVGTVVLTALVPNNPEEQKTIIFDPIPRVDGIEPSADPLLALRAAVYLMSGRRRRAASNLET